MEKEDGKSLKLDVKKRPSSVKRDNNFKVVLADNPTTKSSIAVDEDGSDFSYFAALDFGSSATPMWMLMDTGAANTWVMGSDCTSAACNAHDTFGRPDSDTLNTTASDWTVSYGTGTVSGVVASDKVSFAGFSVELGFGLASNTSDDFNSYPFDGILGLGRPDSNSIGTKTVMETLDDANLLTSNIIGVHLQRNADGAKDGEITFGGVDSSKYTGDISYTPTAASDGLWSIAVDGCGLDGKSTGLTGRTAVLDTGTSYILMPPDDATALHEQFPSYSKSGSSYLIPCDSTAPVQFTFSGVTYDVSPKDYLGAPSGSMCTSNIIGHESFGSSTWLLGDVFLKNVYTVFDFDKDRIGLAREGSGSSSSSSLSSSSTSSSSAAPSASVASAKTASGSASSTASSSRSTSASSSSTRTTSSASASGSSSSSSSSRTSSSSSSSSSGSRTADLSASAASTAQQSPLFMVTALICMFLGLVML